MDKYLNKISQRAVADAIAEKAGVNLKDCYQCGKCSAGCPMARGMDLMPRQVVRHLQMGSVIPVLESKSIWLCATCHTCVDRCPHSINLPGLMEQSRMEAKKRGMIGVNEVDKFTDIFLENVKVFGRNQEVILEGAFNMTTGHFTQDMKNVPHMLKHKIVGMDLNTCKGASEVKDLMKRAEERS